MEPKNDRIPEEAYLQQSQIYLIIMQFGISEYFHSMTNFGIFMVIFQRLMIV